MSRSRALAESPVVVSEADKWALLKDVTAARQHFSVSDRDLAVLSALMSFHPHADLMAGDGTVVFPSNATLSNRLHGMAESTLRRHLAALVQAGLILRHDSPNGKRYAARDGTGTIAAVFGFDLRPLLVRADEIAVAAQAARHAALELRRLREAIVLCLRDAAGLIACAQQQAPGRWDECEDQTRLMQRRLRRKLDVEQMRSLFDAARDLLSGLEAHFEITQTAEMSADDSQNERHIQDSDRDLIESEEVSLESSGEARDEATGNLPRITLGLVMRACPDLLDYTPGGVRHWHELCAASSFVRPMLGITSEVWRAARTAMGESGAAVALACMLQRASRIANPGGYLRILTSRALNGGFSIERMVRALLREEKLC